MSASDPNHYEALGLGRNCTMEEIRVAYRLLGKRHHPDVNGNSATARARTVAINAAYEVLSDRGKRRDYDRELDSASRAATPAFREKRDRNVVQDVRVRIEDLLRGTSLQVQVRDAGNPAGPEVYQLVIPVGTAPGTRFRLPRSKAAGGGYVQLRVKVLPGFRFKVRGSDLQCELRIDNRRASAGGSETIERPAGGLQRIQI